jgi:hypothetical protein
LIRKDGRRGNQSNAKTISNQTLLYLFQLMNMEKLQGSAAFKKTIFALSFRENNKAINTDSYLEN